MSWAVEPFIMVTAISEKDEVPDHKIFHSLVAVEGSCGLLEKPCEERRDLLNPENSVLQLSKNASALVKNTCGLILPELKEVCPRLRKAF